MRGDITCLVLFIILAELILGVVYTKRFLGVVCSVL